MNHLLTEERTIKEGDFIQHSYMTNNWTKRITSQKKMKVVRVEFGDFGYGQDIAYHTECGSRYTDLCCIKAN